MKFVLTIFAIFACLALVSAQNFFYGQFPGRTQIRDPRQNRGPVVFPPSPPDAIEETSGVIVGASGYGFVPPQQSQPYYSTALQTPETSFALYNYYNRPPSYHAYHYSYF